MIAETKILDFRFRSRPWGTDLDRIGELWFGTPYREGCRSLRGIDCVNFGCMLLDYLYGYSRESLALIRGDACLHNKRGVLRAMRAILRTYPKHDRVRDRSLEPADIIVTGPENGGPGHMMVAGGRQGLLWHCTSASGVSRSGYGLPCGHRLFAVYRASDRESWT